jgi:hypothetical protein
MSPDVQILACDLRATGHRCNDAPVFKSKDSRVLRGSPDISRASIPFSSIDSAGSRGEPCCMFVRFRK